MSRSRLFLASVAATVAGLGVLWLTAVIGDQGRADTSSNAVPVAASAQREVAGILADWDRQRAETWANGDPEALSRLYVEGSRAGRADAANLRRWVEQGLRVEGLQTELLDLSVTDHQPDRWTVTVTDRIREAVAVGSGEPIRLPRDEPTRRRIVLERTEGVWRVASVQDLVDADQTH